MTNSIVSALAETANLNGKTQSTTKSALLRRIVPVNTVAIDDQDSLTTKQMSGVGGDDVLKTQSSTAQPQAATAPRKLLRRAKPLSIANTMQQVKAPSIVASTSNAVENYQGDDVSKDTMLMMSDARMRAASATGGVDGEVPVERESRRRYTPESPAECVVIAEEANGCVTDQNDGSDCKHKILKKRRLGTLEIDLSNSSWHQHKASLTGYIIALLQTESPEEVAFRLSAEAREEARVVCRAYHKSFGEFVDSVVLAERNTQAAAAFVSRFDGTLAHVAHGLFLRPLVCARLCQLVVAADVGEIGASSKRR
jgi:hypothetical protein